MTVAEPIAWMLLGVFIHNFVVLTLTCVLCGVILFRPESKR